MKPSSSYSHSKNSTHSSLSDLFHSIFRSRSLYLSLLLSHFPNMYRNVSIVDDRLTFIKRKQNSCAHQKTQKTSATVLNFIENRLLSLTYRNYRSLFCTAHMPTLFSTFISVSLSLYLSLCASLSIALYLNLSLSIYLSISLFIYMYFICLSLLHKYCLTILELNS